MKKIIFELQRREVFRTAGLYVGISWILIEGASVVLPAFDAPEWVLRFLIIAAVIGFPVTAVLAWVYDVTKKGIVTQAAPTDTVVLPFGDRKSDLIVIGVLAVALIFSVFLNITGGPELIEEVEPVSILIADFDNQTGDPLFDDSIEQAMSIGIESASFITAFSRRTAHSRLRKLRPDDAVMDEEAARLLAMREGIQLVMSGEVSADGDRYQFIVQAVEPESGEAIIEIEKTAADKGSVLLTVAEIAGEIREELGDSSLQDESLRGTESFTAASLEAAKAYTEAQELAYSGDYAASIEYYRLAIDEDASFGRAFSGWALAAFNLGRDTEAEQLWQQALTFMDTMTARERYRTLGLYYMAVSHNYPKAIESYESLVENYPADGAGHNNLAVAYFSTLDFKNAMLEGQRVLEIYPSNLFYQQNFALYAMYAGDFELSEARGQQVIDEDASRYYAWLPVAIAELSRDELDAAMRSYESMAAIGDNGSSHASLGLADIALYSGRFADAVALLKRGIDADVAADNARATATKYVALAEAYSGLGDNGASLQAIEQAITVNSGLARQVPAALLHLQQGQTKRAEAIGIELGEQMQSQRRAYGNMILGIIDSLAGKHVAAIDKLRSALDHSDYWLIRFHLGKAYFAAGSFVEALDEFEICLQRRGEATALFLDDLPTWRYLSTLPYWRGRAQQELGMTEAAQSSFRKFVALRTDSDPLVIDARQRVSTPPS